MRLFLLLVVLLLAVCACDRPRPSPDGFDIAAYFDRTIAGTGIIERNGRIAGRLTMVAAGTAEGDQLTLAETFIFDGGRTFARTWHLTQTAPGVWAGTADNVDGIARIEVIDGIVRMNYAAEFPTSDGKMMTFHFNQRLVPLGDGTVLNRSRLSKFSIPVATVTIIFTPAEPAAD